MDAQRKLKIEQAAHAIYATTLTDEELGNAIEIGEEVLVFLRAHGPYWGLASAQMIHDLEKLYGFRQARKRRTQPGRRS